jgi:HTH-type transcriptional regulator, sugar sensing transcriptional regulator
MIINQELIKRIKQHFDLNVYETKVWLSLLSKGIATAGEIAEISEVPRSRTYDVLESLEKRGFIIQKIGKPVKFLAVKPELVIEKLKSYVQLSYEERIDALEKLKSNQDYKELEQIQNYLSERTLKNEEISSLIKGKTNLYTQIRDLLENAKKDVVFCLNIQEFEEKIKFFESIYSKLIPNGIQIKFYVSDYDSNKIKFILEKTKIPKKEIFQLNCSLNLVIIDNNQLIIPLTKKPNTEKDLESVNKEEELAMWINSEFFAGAVNNLLRLSQNQK